MTMHQIVAIADNRRLAHTDTSSRSTWNWAMEVIGENFRCYPDDVAGVEADDESGDEIITICGEPVARLQRCE